MITILATRAFRFQTWKKDEQGVLNPDLVAEVKKGDPSLGSTEWPKIAELPDWVTDDPLFAQGLRSGQIKVLASKDEVSAVEFAALSTNGNKLRSEQVMNKSHFTPSPTDGDFGHVAAGG